MTKEKIITATYIMVSLGLFVLAIETWICGTQPQCRQQNLVASIANAAIDINVPEYFNGWSGSSQPNFSIDLTGTESSITLPSVTTPNREGGGDGDGH